MWTWLTPHKLEPETEKQMKGLHRKRDRSRASCRQVEGLTAGPRNILRLCWTNPSLSQCTAAAVWVAGHSRAEPTCTWAFPAGTPSASGLLSFGLQEGFSQDAPATQLLIFLLHTPALLRAQQRPWGSWASAGAVQAGAQLCEGMGSKGSERKAAASHQFSKGSTVGSKAGRFGRKTRDQVARDREQEQPSGCCHTVLQSIPWCRNRETGSDLGTLQSTRGNSSTLRGQGEMGYQQESLAWEGCEALAILCFLQKHLLEGGEQRLVVSMRWKLKDSDVPSAEPRCQLRLKVRV